MLSNYISGAPAVQRMRVELVEEGGRKVYRYFSVDKPSEENQEKNTSPDEKTDLPND